MPKPKAKKKSRSAPRKRPPKAPPIRVQLFRVAVGLTLLLALVVAAGLLTHTMVTREPTLPEEPLMTDGTVAPSTTYPPPPFEIYPDRDIPVRPPLPEPRTAPTAERPRVAIIIDDLGYDPALAEGFLTLDGPVTFSVLPFAPFSRRIARTAAARGVEIMLHLPMEPEEYPRVDPGPGALTTSMAPDVLIEQLNRNLAAVPGVTGVNNHMGSKMTASSSQLYQIFTVLKQRDLFFIDSRTTPNTLCRPSARLFQLRFAERDVFLDHVQEAEFIRRQSRKLVQIAKSHGEAVGIAHPSRLTIRTLHDIWPALSEEVTLVPASQVVTPVG